MIHINIDVDGMQLDISGHAGFAPVGQDVICAGVSTLAYTLAHNLAMLLPTEYYTATLEEGHAYIEARPPEALAEFCRSIFMIIANGLCLMAAQHDQYIHLEGE